MTSLHNGQCGLCAHFGESHRTSDQVLLQINTTKDAPEDLVACRREFVSGDVAKRV
jgi:hypothetical protein